MKRAPRSRQRHDLYAKYHDYDSEISDLLGECGLRSLGNPGFLSSFSVSRSLKVALIAATWPKITNQGFKFVSRHTGHLLRKSFQFGIIESAAVSIANFYPYVIEVFAFNRRRVASRTFKRFCS